MLTSEGSTLSPSLLPLTLYVLSSPHWSLAWPPPQPPCLHRPPQGLGEVFLHPGLMLPLPSSHSSLGSLVPPGQSPRPSAYPQALQGLSCSLSLPTPTPPPPNSASNLQTHPLPFCSMNQPSSLLPQALCKLSCLLARCALPLHLVNDNQPFKSLVKGPFHHRGHKALSSCHLLSQQP